MIILKKINYNDFYKCKAKCVYITYDYSLDSIQIGFCPKKYVFTLPIEEYLNNMEKFNNTVFNNNYSILCNNDCDFKTTEEKKLVINIDKSCNLNCTMCYAHNIDNIIGKDEIAKRRKLQNIIYKNIIEKNIYMDAISPTEMGEPFFNNYFKNEWLFKITSKNVKDVLIISNIQCIDKEYIDKLYEYFNNNNLNIHITASIDSFEKNRYENIRKNASFEKTIENALYLKSKNILSGLNYSITEYTVDEIENNNIHERFRELGFENTNMYFSKECRPNYKSDNNMIERINNAYKKVCKETLC
jgi:MoaA/NifB/PqqE/SkfB family radical SAM enzyme